MLLTGVKEIFQLARKSDWQVAAREVCRGERSVGALREALLARSSRPRTQQRAGYLLLHVHWRCPERLDDLLPDLLGLVGPGVPPAHPSLARQVFSVFQDRDIPEDLAGALLDAALATFLDRGAPTAARARGLDAAANVARQYAGLWGEVGAAARGIAADESPGVRSIAQRVAAEADRAR